MRSPGPGVRTGAPLFCLPLGTQVLCFGVGRRPCDTMECVLQKDHSDGMAVGLGGNPFLALLRCGFQEAGLPQWTHSA